MAKLASPRDVIPLEIGRYLQDTADLNGGESGAYLHLIFHCWLHGSLPEEDEKLATIAKFTPDAWSIARASVMHYFVRGRDGRFRNPGVDKRRDEWVDKRLKAREKAKKAARARWDKSKEERAKKRVKKADASSIALASPSIEHTPPEVPSLPSPHTPYLTHSPNPLRGGSPPTPNPPLGDARAQAGVSGSGPGPGRVQVAPGEDRAKPTKLTVERLQGAGVGSRVTETVCGPTTIFSVAGNGKVGSRPDDRMSAFQDEVLRYWSEQNPDRPLCPWTRHDSRALLEYLAASPGSTIEHFRRLLMHRAASGENPAALPRKWLRDLEEYSDGPLDRFKKPVRAGRQL